MKPKERLLAVLTGELPDRVPTGELGIDFPITEYVLGRPTFYRAKHREKAALWAGRRDEVVASQKRDLVEAARKLEWDFVPVFLTYAAGQSYAPARFLDADTWEDPYGRTWKHSTVTQDILCVDMPPLDESAIEVLRQPFVPDEPELELVRHVVRELGETHFIVGRTAIELREAGPVAGRGMVDGTFPEPYGGLMMDMVAFSYHLADNPDFVRRLLEAATDRAIQVALALVAAGVDAIVLDTDYCHQTGPWVSPRVFASLVMPLLHKQVDAIHQAGAYVIKHTDGRTWPILDQILDTGVDGLHGIQPSAGMDLATLKERVNGRAALFGAVEGNLLIEHTPDEIRQIVRRQVAAAGPGGRYGLTSSNSVQLGVPPENYLAMLAALREFGIYPLAT